MSLYNDPYSAITGYQANALIISCFQLEKLGISYLILKVVSLITITTCINDKKMSFYSKKIPQAGPISRTTGPNIGLFVLI